ncbi:MAG: serine acetyltransferase [Prevotellamassilia sp.]|nr:serine acetyltransferase [Prevotellamassilia sp.]MDD7564522.1 serine acetyltransferase [Prevotellamassilia sp.]MDY4567958.1 serine acetyltransferase [Alloprevotella sp.]MDY5762847.1 serine acetyltransferase [Alloprevotella sp.]MDY6113918.1 serine acetyltransferase [Alloprevotella sp.]
MNQPDNYAHILAQTVEALSDTQQMKGLFHQHRHGDPLPSAPALEEIICLCRALLFPGYYGKSALNHVTVKYHIGMETERLFGLLTSQIEAGLCFSEDNGPHCDCHCHAAEIAAKLISRLPEVRRILATDVEAAYLGDPAAQNYGEVISCYPVIKALTCYRLAHELHKLGVPLIPRIITEIAHSETGIDIHPAAQIGESFTIDHGTGVVIGATCIIGKNVKLYQGVTLGAKSFPLDADGNPIKNNPRHPIINDDVIIYSNATLLGRITIGKGATIGANVWLTRDVEPGEKVTKTDGTD